MTRLHTAFRLTPLAALFVAGSALATNGYFPHGYGIKAKGMGGASVAMAQDSLGGATNPASMVFSGARMDFGLEWFSPRREASRSGAGVPSLNGSVESDSTNFFVPEFGYNAMLNPNLSLGVSVYGNGGMNTDFPQGSFQCPTGPTTVAPANMLCGSGRLGQDLMQLIVAPTLAYKLTPQHSVGISLLLGYQRFETYGLQAFDNAPGFPPFTGAPGSVTNNGYDSSTGVGVRLGYMGRFGDSVTVGAAYAPKMNMGKFDKYKGLFAGQGDFDIPAHYALGVAIAATPTLTLAFDYERIQYSGVASVGNPSSNPPPLGADNGPGFGWKDINVYKLGVQWQMDPTWTLRAGYNYGQNPISGSDVTFNIIAPGVVTSHYTGGFTWAMSKADEISGSLMVAPSQSVSGSSYFNRLLGAGAAGTETIRMREMSIGVAWSRKF
jgi:long-chain fatty acid transport protein